MRIRKQASKPLSMASTISSPSPTPWEMTPQPSDAAPPPPSQTLPIQPDYHRRRRRHEQLGSGEMEAGEDEVVEKTIILESLYSNGLPSKKELDMVEEENTGLESLKGDGAEVMMCRRSDGRRWKCKRAAEPGSSYCSHHLQARLKRGPRPADSSKKKKKAKKGEVEKEEKKAVEAGARGTAGEIYYYY